MFWHIDTDIVGLLVTCALYVYTVRMLPTDEFTGRNRSFVWCLRCGILMMTVDIAASIVMEVPTTRFLYQLLMTLYFLTLELAIVSWFLYSISILYHDEPSRGKRAALWVVAPYSLYAAVVVANPWTGWIYTLGPNFEYARTPLFVPLVVGVYGVYAVALILLILARRTRIPTGYPIRVLIIAPVLLAAAIPVQLLNPGWLMVMPAYMLCLVLAFLYFQNLRVRNERAQLRQLTEMVEHFAFGVSISEIDAEKNIKVVYVSSEYAAVFEEEDAALSGRLERDVFSGIHPDDREDVQSAVAAYLDGLGNSEVTYRYLTPRGNLKWINTKMEIVRHADGTATSYATYTDLTEQRKAQQRLTDVIQTVPCGICLFHWDGERLRPLLANAQFSEMLGMDAIGHLEKTGGLDYKLVHPDDAPGLRAASLEALNARHKIDYAFRILNPALNQYIWVRERGILIKQSDDTQLVYVSYNDVTPEHRAEQQLRESEQALEYAAAQAGLRCWRYDGHTDTLYPDERNRRDYQLPAVLKNFETEWLSKWPIQPDFAPDFMSALSRIRDGEKQVIFEARGYEADRSPHWYRYCLTNLFDKDGRPTVAVGTSIMIDTEKELWAKYEMERKRTARDDQNLLAHAVFNLTTGQTLEYAYRDGTPVPAADRTTFFDGRMNTELLIDEEERRRFLALNNVNTLLEHLSRGETEFRLEYRRLLPMGEIHWVRSMLHLVREPRNNDVLLFEYWYDIEEEKMLGQMYRSIASDNYDYVARIDGRTRRFEVFQKDDVSSHMPPASGEDADKVTLSLYHENVVPEDKEMVVENMLVEHINRNLHKTGRFQFTYRERMPDGAIRYKKITQYYIDPQREVIAMMREDVTELIHEETEKNKMLAEALEAANQASVAKSRFLSRVSHELRTPLNAIIGFMDLAKDAEDHQIKTYLTNSDIAARQLLSIINDVLDVSAIESGKMRIAHVPFDMKKLLQSITNIFLSQCHQKGLAYETVLATPIDEWLVGDRLRVNQILINLLGNAVKFTESGRVRLTVRHLDTKDGKALMRFEVSDTGCGISEEMQARMFIPFEQENAVTAQKYGGNGLGLSIVGSLVQMMDGAVRVESQVGQGTTFIVDLPFTQSETQIPAALLQNARAVRVLVACDEEAQRDYIGVILKRMGVSHIGVPRAQTLDALEAARAAGDAYSLCLVDWKSPERDGVQTIRDIRERYGGDSLLIVACAYEYAQAEEKARAAGANLFLPKPVFQSSLFDLLSTLTGGRLAQREGTGTRFDFTGRRVLLAEDNEMNRMVAERLLEKRFGLVCECAANGRIALDLFLNSAPGHFDAVLMDIQMPVMDGYETTKAIRESAREDAKTVPIIALTANAFNEDIAKSLSCGMNAHVAKPIDPDTLASALDRVFASP